MLVFITIVNLHCLAALLQSLSCCAVINVHEDLLTSLLEKMHDAKGK